MIPCGKITAMLPAQKVSIPDFKTETHLQQMQQLTEGDFAITNKPKKSEEQN